MALSRNDWFPTPVWHYTVENFQQLNETLLQEIHEEQQQGRPDKKLFSVTAAGKTFLQDWISQPCEMDPLRDDLLVKMFTGSVVSRETILTELQDHRSLHQERLAVYQQIEKNAFANPKTLSDKDLFPYLTLRNGIQFELGWLAWCEEAIAML